MILEPTPPRRRDRVSCEPTPRIGVHTATHAAPEHAYTSGKKRSLCAHAARIDGLTAPGVSQARPLICAAVSSTTPAAWPSDNGASREWANTPAVSATNHPGARRRHPNDTSVRTRALSNVAYRASIACLLIRHPRWTSQSHREGVTGDRLDERGGVRILR